MIKKSSRKGYFYTIDAVIGILILIIGLFIIAGFYFYSPEKDRTEGLANDLTGILANTQIKDVCDLSTCTCSYTTLTDLCNEGLITNPDMTMLELMGYLYSLGYKRSEIEGLINETIIENQVLPISYDMQIVIENPNNDAEDAQLYPLIEE